MSEVSNLRVSETPGCLKCVFVSMNVTVKTVMFVCKVVTDALLGVCLCVRAGGLKQL